jgi:hypothetical protein
VPVLQLCFALPVAAEALKNNHKSEGKLAMHKAKQATTWLRTAFRIGVAFFGKH